MSLYEKETYALDNAINNFIDSNPDIELTAEIVKEIIDSVESDIKANIENICKYIQRQEIDITDWRARACADGYDSDAISEYLQEQFKAAMTDTDGD